MFLKYNSYTVLWAMFIALLSLSPRIGSAENYGSHFDKIIHAILYCFLVTISMVGFKKQHSYYILKSNAALFAISLSIVYGVLMECIQHYIPGRAFDLYDILSNSIGALLGFGLFYLIYRKY